MESESFRSFQGYLLKRENRGVRLRVTGVKFFPKRRACQIFIFFSLLFLLTAPLPGAGLPREILHLPPGETAVLVNKSEQKLFLFKVTKQKSITMEKKFICATGKVSGDKQHAGDRRTPAGIYFCRRILLPPRLGKRYGACAVPLNYPNLVDRRHGRDGDGIWLHGINESRPVKSTRGCVVLQNRDLVYLAGRIHLHISPVIIVEKMIKNREKLRAGAEKAALAFLKRWRHAWVYGDIAAYISCYDASFLSRGMNLRQWRAYKRRLFRRYRHAMTVDLGEPVIVGGEDYLVFAFRQHFRGGKFSADGLKRLYVKHSRGRFRIIGEAWIPERELLKAWRHYTRALSKITAPADGYHIVAALPGKTKRLVKKDPYREIKQLLSKWKTAWEARDINDYAVLYSSRFKPVRMGLDEWKAHKINTFRKNGAIHLKMKKIRINIRGKVASVHFTQVYRSRRVTDTGRKDMILCRESGTWKIFRERWQRFR